MLRINHTSISNIGAAIKPAMWTWLRLWKTLPGRSTIAYISRYMIAKDIAIIANRRR